MEHDISHIKDIGDIMNIFFYLYQSVIQLMRCLETTKTTRSQDAGCAGTKRYFNDKRIRKGKACKKYEREEHIIQMLTKVI